MCTSYMTGSKQYCWLSIERTPIHNWEHALLLVGGAYRLGMHRHWVAAGVMSTKALRPPKLNPFLSPIFPHFLSFTNSKTHTHSHTPHTPSLSLQEGYTPTHTCSYLYLAQLQLTTSTMELEQLLQVGPHPHTLTDDFVLGGKNKSLLEMYGSTVWHEFVSMYACMCDYIFHTPKRRALLVSTSTCTTLHMYT